MAIPTVPTIDYSYTAFQQGQGNNDFPGTQIDNDLLNLREGFVDVVAFLEGSFQSDGVVKPEKVPGVVEILDALGSAVVDALAAHVAEPDPHTQYLLEADAPALITDHVGEIDPHPQYLLESAAPALISAHVAEPDPHPQYLLETGYTAADVLTKVKSLDGTGSGLDADLVHGSTPGAFGLTLLEMSASGDLAGVLTPESFGAQSIDKAARAPIAVANGYAELVERCFIANATPTEYEGNLRITGSATQPQTIFYSVFPGATGRWVAARVRLVSGSWNGAVFYATAAHAASTSYYGSMGAPTTGTWTTIIVDMWALTAGGTDWYDNEIGYVRFNLGAASSVIDVAWLAVLADRQVAINAPSGGASGFVETFETCYDVQITTSTAGTSWAGPAVVGTTPVLRLNKGSATGGAGAQIVAKEAKLTRVRPGGQVTVSCLVSASATTASGFTLGVEWFQNRARTASATASTTISSSVGLTATPARLGTVLTVPSDAVYCRMTWTLATVATAQYAYVHSHEYIHDLATSQENSTEKFVATRTALKAVNTAAATVVRLTEAGRSGVFVWNGTVPIATHTADTAEGVYVAPNAGADGAWVRQRSGQYALANPAAVEAGWFGMSPAATAAANLAALNAALAFSPAVDIDGGVFAMQGTVARTGSVALRGKRGLTTLNWTGVGGIAITSTSDTGEKYHIGDLILRTDDTATTSTAISIDGAAQAFGGTLADRHWPRGTIENVMFAGTTNYTSNGWNKGILFKDTARWTVQNCAFTGYIISGATEPQGTLASNAFISIEESTTAIHPTEFNIVNNWVFFTENGLVTSTQLEGLIWDRNTCVVCDFGIQAESSDSTNNPQITVLSSHFNVRIWGIKATNFSQVNIRGCNLYQRPTLSVGGGVLLVNCKDSAVQGNQFTAQYAASSGIAYYGVVLGSGTTACTVSGNTFRDTAVGVWFQTGSLDNIANDNILTRQANATAELYTDTPGTNSRGQKSIEWTSPTTATSASGPLGTIDLGTVYTGQRLLVSVYVTMTKGATTGMSTVVVFKSSGTATIDGEVRWRATQTAAAVDIWTFTGVLKVTASGTLVLGVNYSTAGSAVTITAGDAKVKVTTLDASLLVA